MGILQKTSSDELEHDEIAAALLDEAGVLDSLPTPENALLTFLGLTQLSFNFGEEPEWTQLSPEIPKKLRAALSVNDRVVVTHSELGPKRNRWSVFHEIAHFVLPEHLEKIFLDDDRTLNIWTRSRLEREANSLAAELLFQGNRFTEESLDLPLSCRTVFDLAPRFDASYESAIRRYVERHVLPCAAIVYDRVRSLPGEDIADQRYRVHYTVASAPFKKKFFSAVTTDSDFARGSEIFQVHGSENIGNVIETPLTVQKHGGGEWVFDSELFTNSYKIFQLVIGPPKAE